MSLIDNEFQLAHCLHQAQEAHQKHASCELTAAFASRRTDAKLCATADLLLHRTQQRAYQVRRRRDGTLCLGVTMTLREGIRIAEAARSGKTSRLNAEEMEALRIASAAAEQARAGTAGEEACFFALFRWLSEHAVYENHQPGTAAYAEVVGATGALVRGRANCQGFADAYWLLCTLAGLTADLQLGFSGRGTHLWNLIRIGGRWYAADVSRGARLLREKGESALEAAFMLDRSACLRLGLRWEPWMEAWALGTGGESGAADCR